MLDRVAGPQRDAPADGDRAVAEHRLEEILVHAERGRRDAGADVGHRGELEQALHRAVLAERAVQDRQHDVDRAERRRARRSSARGGCPPPPRAAPGARPRAAPSARRARSRSSTPRSARGRARPRRRRPTRARSRARSSGRPRARRPGRGRSRSRGSSRPGRSRPGRSRSAGVGVVMSGGGTYVPTVSVISDVGVRLGRGRRILRDDDAVERLVVGLLPRHADAEPRGAQRRPRVGDGLEGDVGHRHGGRAPARRRASPRSRASRSSCPAGSA